MVMLAPAYAAALAMLCSIALALALAAHCPCFWAAAACCCLRSEPISAAPHYSYEAAVMQCAELTAQLWGTSSELQGSLRLHVPTISLLLIVTVAEMY